MTKVSLSRPSRESWPIATPSQSPGFASLESKCRVAPADVRVVLEDVPELMALGEFDERASGIGDRDELLTLAARQRVEVLEQRECLDRAAGFRRDHEERVLELDLVLHLEDRVGVGRVEHVQVERVRWCAERPPEDLGREARSAHAEQHRVFEVLADDLARERDELVGLLEHRIGDIEPPQAVGDLGRARGAPERLVVLPDAPRDLLVDRLPHALRDRARELRRDRGRDHLRPACEHALALVLDPGEELVHWRHERRDALI